MLYLKPVIERIGKLASSDSSADLTYAALECRLAIERVCYERLRISHDYIAHDDLRRWQPKDVVNFLVQEVDPKIASTYTLSMSKDPVAENDSLEGIAEDRGREWVKIGTQVGFDAKKLGELWNALSNVALHVRLPTSKSDLVSEYGDPSKIAAKIKECLEELRRISEGTLFGTGMGEEVTFECACGRTIKRRSQRLRHHQVISCVGIDCLESYRVEKDGDDYFFERRKTRLYLQ